MNNFVRSINTKNEKPSEHWKTLGEIENKSTKTSIQSIPIFREHICDTLNDFFVNIIGKDMANKIGRKHIKTREKSNVNSIVIMTTENKVCGIIRALNKKKTAGIDGLTRVTLTKIVDHVISPLTYLINKSIEGLFPDSLKESIR
ncbi:hypothetical protein HHI36_009584 [Cryptolaemus montrouzieri]|uniref:Uncharacterized protein n=1 Tax=Cryptolaemus montrouzieri TaxID=559131 RepID=A0ABD2MGQ7_9CUCU